MYDMEYGYIKQLDEFFCAQFADYVRIAAIEGYQMPEMLTVGPDGNIVRRDSKFMRLCYQPEWETLLRRFKDSLADTEFTFDFRFPGLRDRICDRWEKDTFAKYLPKILSRYDFTPETAGKLLTVEEFVWNKIVKGKLYPEKNVVMALALVCRMGMADVNNLLAVCGFELKADNVRDVVFDYLVIQKVFNEEMRDRCLAEYKIDTLPIAAARNGNGRSEIK